MDCAISPKIDQNNIAHGKFHQINSKERVEKKKSEDKADSPDAVCVVVIDKGLKKKKKIRMFWT